MPPLIRCLQTLTAAAVVFAILGACGIAPPRRGPVVLRPRRPGPDVTIRSLTGEWEAVHGTAAGPRLIRMTLLQSGDSLRGSLAIGSRTLPSDPASPAQIDASGRFSIVFGQSQEMVGRGRVDASGDWFSLEITGLEAQPISLIFQRR